MKKVLVAAFAAVFALALAGCASGSASSASAGAQSSSDSASADSSVTSSVAEQVEPEGFLDWEKADSAAEAAQAAGFESFEVPAQIVLGKLTFENAWFGFNDGVAEAVYEQPACAVYIRKADSVYAGALTDRTYDEFAAKWTQDCEGLEVNCYGAADGEATVIQWNDGSTAYAVTYQGLGGEEMTMTPDEIASLVESVK